MTEILTVEQVAQELQVSDKTVYNWIKTNRLKATNIGTQRKANYRIRRADLNDFISKGFVSENDKEWIYSITDTLFSWWLCRNLYARKNPFTASLSIWCLHSLLQYIVGKCTPGSFLMGLLAFLKSGASYELDIPTSDLKILHAYKEALANWKWTTSIGKSITEAATALHTQWDWTDFSDFRLTQRLKE